jgi:hypothetical protein
MTSPNERVRAVNRKLPLKNPGDRLFSDAVYLNLAIFRTIS